MFSSGSPFRPLDSSGAGSPLIPAIGLVLEGKISASGQAGRMPTSARPRLQNCLPCLYGSLVFRSRRRCATFLPFSLHPVMGNGNLRYLFEDCVLDTDRRELRRGTDLVALEPQVFDLLVHLVRNRERVVSKDDLLASVWHGRTVSEIGGWHANQRRPVSCRRQRRGATPDQNSAAQGRSFCRRRARRAISWKGSNRRRRRVETRPRLSGKAVDRRLAVHEHERRCRAGLLCRRHI